MAYDIEKGIQANLRVEARRAVRDPDYILPPRTSERHAQRARMIEEEERLYHAEVTAMNEKECAAIRERLHGYDEEWEAWAKSLYADDGIKLISKARDWKDEVSWPYSSEVEKLRKIEQLVKWKIHDRARGRGSVEEDLET